jgi:hypothetical protein
MRLIARGESWNGKGVQPTPFQMEQNRRFTGDGPNRLHFELTGDGPELLLRPSNTRTLREGHRARWRRACAADRGERRYTSADLLRGHCGGSWALFSPVAEGSKISFKLNRAAQTGRVSLPLLGRVAAGQFPPAVVLPPPDNVMPTKAKKHLIAPFERLFRQNLLV